MLLVSQYACFLTLIKCRVLSSLICYVSTYYVSLSSAICQRVACHCRLLWCYVSLCHVSTCVIVICYVSTCVNVCHVSSVPVVPFDGRVLTSPSWWPRLSFRWCGATRRCSSDNFPCSECYRTPPLSALPFTGLVCGCMRVCACVCVRLSLSQSVCVCMDVCVRGFSACRMSSDMELKANFKSRAKAPSPMSPHSDASGSPVVCST